MSYSEDSGYIPATFNSIMDYFRVGVNEQFGTTYSVEEFVGTNFYKHFYRPAQRIQQSETTTSEIYQKVKDYILATNLKIQRPANTNQGIIDTMASFGYLASVKQTLEADAGKIYICVDVDDTNEDYAATKLEIATIIKNSTAIGMITMGDQVETIVLSNGQSFDWKYSLPDKTPILLRLTLTQSENNQFLIDDSDTIKNNLINNIEALYKLGKNFEPQRYFTFNDAPWCSEIHLEYSIDDGANWIDNVYNAEFDELLTFSLEDITLVES